MLFIILSFFPLVCNPIYFILLQLIFWKYFTVLLGHKPPPDHSELQNSSKEVIPPLFETIKLVTFLFLKVGMVCLAAMNIRRCVKNCHYCLMKEFHSGSGANKTGPRVYLFTIPDAFFRFIPIKLNFRYFQPIKFRNFFFSLIKFFTQLLE